MFNLSENPRVIISMESLAGAFYILLQNKPYDEITIQEICNKAGVTRKTFYRNFETKEDLFDYYVYQIITIEFPQNRYLSLRETLEHFFNYFNQERTLLLICQKNNLFDLLFERLSKYLELNEHFSEAISDVKDVITYGEYYWQSLNSIQIRILQVWTERGFKESVDELVNIFIDITKRFGKIDYSNSDLDKNSPDKK